MAELTGFRVKYQEAGGDILTNFFDKNLASGKHCGRTGCPPCEMKDGKVNCKARNIVYESKCLVCNPQTSQQEDDHDNQPSGTDDYPREGIYIGESSRSLHERALEHVRDAQAFSAKSHITKHWMNSHPSLPSPPKMEFSITSRFRDCLSRQIGEALRINYSKDTLLNSKAEYMANSLTRLTMKEDPWELKERTRKEEVMEELNKKQVEEFKKLKLKSAQPCSTASVVETVPLQETEPSQTSSQSQEDTSHEQGQIISDTVGGGGGVNTLTGTECNIVLMEDVLTPTLHYETDEEEFTRPGNVEQNFIHQVSAQAQLPATNTPKQGRKARPRACQGYNLGYLSLWWKRMEREGKKEEEERKVKDEEAKRRAHVKRWLNTKKEKLKIKKKSNTQGLGLGGPGGGGEVPLSIMRSGQHPLVRIPLRGGATDTSYTGKLDPGSMEGWGEMTNADNVIHERSQPNNFQQATFEHHHGTDRSTAVTNVSLGTDESESNLQSWSQQ